VETNGPRSCVENDVIDFGHGKSKRRASYLSNHNNKRKDLSDVQEDREKKTCGWSNRVHNPMCVKPLTVLKGFSGSGGSRFVKFGQDETSGRTLWNQLSSDKRW
jgi:hypothetical protein